MDINSKMQGIIDGFYCNCKKDFIKYNPKFRKDFYDYDTESHFTIMVINDILTLYSWNTCSYYYPHNEIIEVTKQL